MNKLKIFTQTPVTTKESSDYIATIQELAKLTEEFGYTGILVRYGEDKIDPWLLSIKILEHTTDLIPFIAVQEDTIPPFTNAKMALGASFMYERSIFFNIISGTDKQIKENVPPETRYKGLSEYIKISKALLQLKIDNLPYKGEFHKCNYDRAIGDISHTPKFYLSGTSYPGINAASNGADGFLTIPYPYKEFRDFLSNSTRDNKLDIGICLGIITRPTSIEAYEAAKLFFPVTRESRIKAMVKRSSNVRSIRYLAELAFNHEFIDEVYWLGGFCSDQTIYPYLVGSYEAVASYLQKYIDLGVNTIISSTKPSTKEEFMHNKMVFDRLKKDERRGIISVPNSIN